MRDWLYTLARVLLPVLFIEEGVGQFANVHAFADMLQSSNLPFQGQLGALGANRFVILGYAVAVIEIACGVMVMLGYKARIAAILLAAFTIGAIYVGHPFWRMEGSLRAINLTHALKNLSIIAALLMVAAKGPGMLALDNWRRRY